MIISNYIVIGLGGAVGAISRVALSRVLPAELFGIPAQILCINVLGSLMIGLLTELWALHWSVSINMRYFLISGFLGGFTTFSTFVLEFGLLFEKNEYFSAIIYVMLSTLCSILFFFSGAKLVRMLV